MGTPETDITRRRPQRTAGKAEYFRLNIWKLSRECKRSQHALLGQLSQLHPGFKYSLCFDTYWRCPSEM